MNWTKLSDSYRNKFPGPAMIAFGMMIAFDVSNAGAYSDLLTNRHFLFEVIGLIGLVGYFVSQPLELDPADPSDLLRINLGKLYGLEMNENSNGTFTPIDRPTKATD